MKMPINFTSEPNEILLNPRFSDEEKNHILNMLHQSPPIQNHVWMATSGSTADSPIRIKWTALSKKAILASAQAVNTFLSSDHRDIWGASLPSFHVGGLGIWARGFLSGAQVIDTYTMMNGIWDPIHFTELVHHFAISLTSLVPTQVYDIAKQEIKAPPSLRGVIVGGGALQEPIYKKSIELGWPLLPSYGLTECCSQVATAEVGSWETTCYPRYKLLPHIQVSITPEGFIAIKSSSLLTYYALATSGGAKFFDPKNDGWFLTEDLGELEGSYLKIYGRQENFIKIGGESVHLEGLQKILDEIRLQNKTNIDMALFAMPDERLGAVIHLAAATDEKQSIENLVVKFQNRVLPFEKIRKIHYIHSIPRTSLSKIKHKELLKLVLV
jgi:o-succinylbenzoate---CoA ligase